MPDTRLDVLCIGNAIVDVIADATDEFLAAEGLTKDSMRLVDAEEATRLYGHMQPALEVSGGCAGNTAAGVEFTTPAVDGGIPTARSMILVTPDGHRTMNTFLGAAQELSVEVLDEEQIRSSGILYLEGYLWDAETPRYAMVRAIEVARDAGRKVAFSLSDLFCVDRHREGFTGLIDQGRIDILFANEAEILAMGGVPHLETAVAAIAPKVETLVVTRGAAGALAVRGNERADIPAEPVAEVVDTTGAGDLFAAGFLYGKATGRSLAQSLKLGAIAAGEIIQHYGARPEADLRALAGELAA